MYNPIATRKMEAELTEFGVAALKSPTEVEQQLNGLSDFAVFINSVCGRAGKPSRRALTAALAAPPKPEKVFTVFAGVDKAATEALRGRAKGEGKSSPSYLLFKGGEVGYAVERHQFYGFEHEELVDFLRSLHKKYFSGEGVLVDMAIKTPYQPKSLRAEEVKKLIDNPNERPVLVDCRSKEEAKVTGTIPMSFFLDDFSIEPVLGYFMKLSHEATIICFNNGNEGVEPAMGFLQKMHRFYKVFNLEGGLKSWPYPLASSLHSGLDFSVRSGQN